jgi:uncharacterized membrane protein YcfT
MILTKQLSVLVANVVVFKGNLGIIKEKGFKDKSVLTLVKNKQCLIIYYAFNINLNVFAGLIKYPCVSRNSF